MKISSKPGKQLCARIGRVATAFAFALTICGIAARATYADDQHGHDNRDGNERHSSSHSESHRSNYRSESQPDYYYAPAPNYYSTPEPDYYYAPQPNYYAPQPSRGVNLFFGF